MNDTTKVDWKQAGETVLADARADLMELLQATNWPALRDQLLERCKDLEPGSYEEMFDFLRAIDLLRDELIAWASTKPTNRKYRAELRAVEEALGELQEQAAAAPADDWRSALPWQVAQDTFDTFRQKAFDAVMHPQKPADFRHWREQYGDDYQL